MMERKVYKREFFDELYTCKTNPLTYTIFNEIEDDFFVGRMNMKYKNKYSIDDFVFYEFDLSDKEKFLLKMHNSDFMRCVKKLKKKLDDCEELRVYFSHNDGYIRVVKFKEFNLHDLRL